MRQILKKVLLASISMFAGFVAFAQVTTSTLSGRIVDQGSVATPGVAVIATHVPSGTVYAAITNTTGNYTIQGMRPGGPYSVEISCLGYQTLVYTDITLELASVFNLNAVVNEDAEQLSEAVVIGVAASRFNQEKTGAATNVTSQQITNLPSISRSISDVAKLSPYGGNGMSIAGGDGRSTNFTVDGADFNQNFGLSSALPGGGNPISLDAIEEMQIVVSPFDVRQTNFIGGGINAITKSGTNTFKGTAYVYHQNENMRGDSIEGEQISGARDNDRTTTYGFTLGGPILKNKLFFFVSYEYVPSPTVITRWQPTHAVSSTANEYGIRYGTMDAESYQSRTSIEDMEMVAKFVKDKYGYDPGSITDFGADESTRKMLARIDWNISDAHKLAVRFNRTIAKQWYSTNGTSMDGGERSPYNRISQYSMVFSNSFYSQDRLAQTISFDLNSRLNNNLSNQFLATYSKLDDARGSNSEPFPFIDIMDGTGTNTPYMSLGYELFTWYNGVHNRVLNLKDDITYFNGDHKVTAGVSYEYQMADNAYNREGTGYYRYKSLADFMNGGTPEVVSLTYGYDGELNPSNKVRYSKLGLYAQDEWSVNDKLKLTYGARIDGLVFNNNDIITNNAILDLTYYDKKGNEAHIDTGKWPTSKLIFSPRIGFNWDVLGDKSFKIRGGTGLFSGRLPLVFFTNMPTNSNMSPAHAYLGPKGDKVDMTQFNGGLVTDANGKPTIQALLDKLISMGYPSTVSPEDGVLGTQVNGVDPKFKMPQVWKTSLAFDYSLPTEFPFTITAEGIFNKTLNAACISDWSLMPVDGFARFNGPDNRPIYPNSFRYTYTDNGKTKDLPSAYVLTNTNKGYGYIATLSMNMRPVEGLNIMAAYTHTVTRELTGMPGSDASSAFTYIPTYEGPNNPLLHNSTNMQPDRVIASLTYNDKSNNQFSFMYEGIRGTSSYTYMYSNDMNGDNYNYDVIYIPKDKNEIRFVSEDDRDRFWNYVENDKYLRSHKGQYAEAYSVYNPWVHRIDFRYSHDFKVKVGNTTNTLQLNFNVQNLANLFNSTWGVAKYMNSALNGGRILKYEGIDGEGYPTFSTISAVQPDVQKWTISHSIGQCWYAQIGLKYMFN